MLYSGVLTLRDKINKRQKSERFLFGISVASCNQLLYQKAVLAFTFLIEVYGLFKQTFS